MHGMPGPLKMQINKNDRNDAEGLAQIMRTGWYRLVHVKSFEAHRARALLGARSQLVGMTTRLSNHIRGVLKTFGLLPGACAVFLSIDASTFCLTTNLTWPRSSVRCVTAWRRLREQIAVFDKAIGAIVKQSATCRLLMSATRYRCAIRACVRYTVEDPARFSDHDRSERTWD